MNISNDVIVPIDLDEVKNSNIIIPNSISVLTSFYYGLQKILTPDCFFEVGAFEADFSRTMKNVFPSSDVWAFEANSYNYDHYKSINKNINYLNLAISDTNNKIKFYLQDKKIDTGLEIEKIRGNNSILNRNDDSILYKEVEIESVTLDSFIENNFIVNKSFSLWIDVEGANKNILLGFDKYLQNSLSILIEVEEFEYWKNQWLSNDVSRYLKQRGFIPIARDFEDNNQYNVVFINSKILEDNILNNLLKDWIKSYFNKLQLEILN